MNVEDLKGCAVKSLAGRDQGRIYLVLGREGENYLLLADGAAKKLESPKKKKIKHAALFSSNEESRIKQKLCSGEKVTNAEIRRAISHLTAGTKPDEESGRD